MSFRVLGHGTVRMLKDYPYEGRYLLRIMDIGQACRGHACTGRSDQRSKSLSKHNCKWKQENGMRRRGAPENINEERISMFLKTCPKEIEWRTMHGKPRALLVIFPPL